MSLKVLRASYYDGEENVLHVAGTTLLTHLQSLCAATNPAKIMGGGASDKDPFRGMKTRAEWHGAIDALRATPTQYVRFADTVVIKAPNSYYMTAPGIVSHGVTERGGPSYNEFRDLLKGMGKTDAAIAVGLRSLLAGQIPKLTAQYAPMAALAAAMFLAEPKRNARAFAVNLMLVDMVEQGLTYGSRERKLTWDNVLWRDGFGTTGADKEKTYTLAEGDKTLKAHERGGKLPMSHTGASEQSKVVLPAPPVPDTDVLYPNAELEKEASLVVRWLQHYLNAQNKTFGKASIALRPGPTASFAERASPKTRAATYAATFEGLQHGGVGCRYLDISKPDKFNPYETVLADQIKAALKLRHDSLSSIKLG